MDVLPFIIKDLLSMQKTKRGLSDCIPFLMLCLSLIISLVLLWSNNYVVQWQHYLGIVFLSCNAILFKRHHKKGVLFLGLTIILGIVGWLAFQFGIVGALMYLNNFDFKIPVFAGNPILFLVFILHFAISGCYYDGILTKKYWDHINISDW